MKLGDRKKEILRAVIESYITTAEPVGSKALAGRCGLGVSAATIRNEMAELEAMGLLEQPHTSAGRAPTPRGYRVYVDDLMREHKLSVDEMEAVNSAMRSRILELDRMLDNTGKLVARLMSYPAYALTASRATATISRYDFISVDQNTFIVLVMLGGDTVKNKLIRSAAPISPHFLTRMSALFNASFTGVPESAVTKSLIAATERAAGDTEGLVAVVAGFSIELLAETRTSQSHVSGALRLFDYPEYHDVYKASRVIRYLSDDAVPALPGVGGAEGVRITIGPENLADELRDLSVVVASCDAGADMRVMVGVVGPTRMDYSKVASRLEYITKVLGWQLSAGGEEREMLENPDAGEKNSTIGDDNFGRGTQE